MPAGKAQRVWFPEIVERLRDEWYKDKLKAGETIENGSSFTASDDKLEFMFGIWNRSDAHCCPTAGLVRVTYKIT